MAAHGRSIEGYLPSGDDLFILANDLYSSQEPAELPFAEMPAPPSLPATDGRGAHQLATELELPPSARTGEPLRRLAADKVMRVAGARYIRFAPEQEVDDPFGSTMLSALTMEETQDVELAHLLPSAADKVGNKEYDRAVSFLSYCDRSASATGNPVQRVVHHFAGALETGKKEKTTRRRVANMYKLFRPQPAIIACDRHLHFPRIMELTEVQAVVDNVASSTEIHLIDLSIRIGLQWIGLMQALSTTTIVPIELLRITAFGASKDAVDETG